MITPKEGVRASDYVFTLSDTHGAPEGDLDAAGEAQFAPHRSTLLRIEGRRRGRRGQVTLGTGIALTVDEGDCFTRRIGAALIDDAVSRNLTELTSSTAEIRLRSRVVGVDPVRRSPDASLARRADRRARSPAEPP